MAGAHAKDVTYRRNLVAVVGGAAAAAGDVCRWDNALDSVQQVRGLWMCVCVYVVCWTNT